MEQMIINIQHDSLLTQFVRAKILKPQHNTSSIIIRKLKENKMKRFLDATTTKKSCKHNIASDISSGASSCNQATKPLMIGTLSHIQHILKTFKYRMMPWNRDKQTRVEILKRKISEIFLDKKKSFTKLYTYIHYVINTTPSMCYHNVLTSETKL